MMRKGGGMEVWKCGGVEVRVLTAAGIAIPTRSQCTFKRSFCGRERLVILRELPSDRSALSVSEEVLSE